MSIAEDLLTIAKNVPRVHQAGYSKGESDFWDIVQRSGARTNYESAFAYWDCEYLRPKHKVVPTARLFSICMNMRNLKSIEKAYFDFSQASTNNTSSTNGNYTLFRTCGNLKIIEDVGLKAGYYYETFRGCSSLETVEILRSESSTMYYNAFYGCSALKNITIDGVIGQDGFNVSGCNDLTKESIVSIVSSLSENLTSSKTITLPKTAVRKHFPNDNSIAGAEWSNAEWSSLIEKKKNWSFALG